MNVQGRKTFRHVQGILYHYLEEISVIIATYLTHKFEAVFGIDIGSAHWRSDASDMGSQTRSLVHDWAQRLRIAIVLSHLGRIDKNQNRVVNTDLFCKIV